MPVGSFVNIEENSMTYFLVGVKNYQIKER